MDVFSHIVDVAQLIASLLLIFVTANTVKICREVDRPHLRISKESSHWVPRHNEKREQWCYYLNVANEKGAYVNNASVTIKRISDVNNGMDKTIFEGPADLSWVGTKTNEPETVTLGRRSCYCNFIIANDDGVCFCTCAQPCHLYTEAFDFLVTLQVVSDEAESKEISIRVKWDGEKSNINMYKHLSVEFCS